MRSGSIPIALLLAAIWTGCAAPATTGTAVIDTERELVRYLIGHGWSVEPVETADDVGLATTGTVYRVRRSRWDGREVRVFAYDDDERPALDRDAVLLTRRHAGTGIAVYKRPALLVVTFGRIRTELDLRLV